MIKKHTTYQLPVTSRKVVSNGQISTDGNGVVVVFDAPNPLTFNGVNWNVRIDYTILGTIKEDEDEDWLREDHFSGRRSDAATNGKNYRQNEPTWNQYSSIRSAIREQVVKWLVGNPIAIKEGEADRMWDELGRLDKEIADAYQKASVLTAKRTMITNDLAALVAEIRAMEASKEKEQS